jgi:undecaprenyl diphosphate synthase
MKTPGEKAHLALPRHIAIIMDGNRRWAKIHRLPSIKGHRAGVKSLRLIVELLAKYKIPYLTVYGFSTENWRRSKVEVEGLFMLLEEVLNGETLNLHSHDIRLRHLGQLKGLPPKVQDLIKNSVEITKNNRTMVISFAFNYGGRAEIIDAVRRVVTDNIEPRQVDEKLFADYLYTKELPDVDLVIRTGGEVRLSNFLTWQTIYSELYFTDVLWPDFNAAEMEKALLFYSQKQRRFGSG